MAAVIGIGGWDRDRWQGWKKLGQKLERIVKNVPGQMGVAVEDVETI